MVLVFNTWCNYIPDAFNELFKITHFTSAFCVIFSTHSLQICRRWNFFSTFEDFHFDRLLSWSRCFIFSETFDLRFLSFLALFQFITLHTQTPTHASTQASGSRIFFEKKDQNQNYSLMMSLAIRINRLQAELPNFVLFIDLSAQR